MINFFRKLGLTKRDLILISMLLLTLIAGLIIKAAGWKNSKTYDYSSSDVEFEKNLKSAFTKVELDEQQKLKLKQVQEYSDSLLNEKESATTLKTGEVPLNKININEALSADLQLLPGIGGVTAERIIEYREQTGKFNSIEDLMNVKGIGVKKFAKLKNLITVN